MNDDVIHLILLNSDIPTIINFIKTSKNNYDLKYNIDFWSKKSTNICSEITFIEIWNVISTTKTFKRIKNKVYSKKDPHYCYLMSDINEFFQNTNKGMFNEINYYRLFRKTPSSFCYILNIIKNWNQCMNTCKNKICLKETGENKYFCTSCVRQFSRFD